MCLCAVRALESHVLCETKEKWPTTTSGSQAEPTASPISLYLSQSNMLRYFYTPYTCAVGLRLAQELEFESKPLETNERARARSLVNVCV